MQPISWTSTGFTCGHNPRNYLASTCCDWRDTRAATASVPDVDAVSSSITLSEGLALYLKHKGAGRPVTFHRAAERTCGYVIDSRGDKPLDAYTRADANAFRDSLIEQGLAGSSMTRVFGTVRSIINFAASEQGIAMTNPFAGVYYDRDAGVSDRQPVPNMALRNCNRSAMFSMMIFAGWSRWSRTPGCDLQKLLA